VRAQSEFAVRPIAETGASFVENAILKARHASVCSGLPALADDSGLVVDALPAGNQACTRHATPEKEPDDAANNRKLLAALRDVPTSQRGARFHCVLALLRHPADPVPLICAGAGKADRHCRRHAGAGGFGYDPLFVPVGEGRTAAELPRERRTA
jgi:XTP/dITP diphosphohydrolase